MMRIDVLTVSGCPHRWLAMTRLREAIHLIGVDAVVTEQRIDDPEVAAAVGMAGSPTILVDGRDLFGAAALEPSISCRLYRTETGVEGAPRVNALIDALTSRAADPVSPCCHDDFLSGPYKSEAARDLGVRGFVTLWRGERRAITELTTDLPLVRVLTAAGRIELDDEGTLVGAHGLTARATSHRIEHAHGTVNTWCALDAIGIPAALLLTATAVTACPHCGGELRVLLQTGRVSAQPDVSLWLPGGPCSNLVEDFCRHANLYCSREHLAAVVPPDWPGRAVDVAEAAAIGRISWHDVASALDLTRRRPPSAARPHRA